ncbi:heme peroxidase family protein [Aminobacter anthyllidis]|uniref:peroxidase family protein n=1 Tax=Aminobacter anthyllidis TaxID=1035067 RepID=UPI002454028E|nr:heme peroxidase family protein [Aminobacter anthyllidis]MDH4988576.1 heme peroxidase family protein [Aminobacter anthyllidis]
MAGPNLRQRIGHGFVSRQVVAENAAIAAAQQGAGAEGFAPLAVGGAKGEAFFDFMFGELRGKGLKADDAPLFELAKAMVEPDLAADDPGQAALDNPAIPAGFTYLGQFVDHDITLDLTPLADAQADPEMTRNFRTPGLDLDCVYGAGPGPHRFLFERAPNSSGEMVDTPKLLLGTAEATRENVDKPAGSQVKQLVGHDLPRNAQGVALIGDHRNDENLIVAQLHLAFLKFHNAVVEHLRGTVPDNELFNEASKTVRWHYQWMVLHDWVERLTETGIVARILHEGRKFYRFKTKPFMPWEFSGAAYRLGHSMVRPRYNHNRIFRSPDPHLAEGTFNFFFRFTNLSGGLDSGTPGQGTFPSNWVIDWRRYFDLPAPPAIKAEFNHSRRLDALLASELGRLPGSDTPEKASLAFRNLRRGVQIGLPSGQDVAALMREKIAFDPISAAEIAADGPDGPVAKSLGFHDKTPLWYYILKEASIRGGGKKLGPVGARIIAETFIGIVQGDAASYLSQPGWKPHLPAATPDTFFMTDLLKFVAAAGDPNGVADPLNPVGD